MPGFFWINQLWRRSKLGQLLHRYGFIVPSKIVLYQGMSFERHHPADLACQICCQVLGDQSPVKLIACVASFLARRTHLQLHMLPYCGCHKGLRSDIEISQNNNRLLNTGDKGYQTGPELSVDGTLNAFPTLEVCSYHDQLDLFKRPNDPIPSMICLCTKWTC